MRSQRWTLFFEPMDVLLFRDTRPLDPGVSIVAHSVWPGPSVFYGCIRAALLRHCGATGTPFQTENNEFRLTNHVDEARRILGGPNRLGTLTLRGPLLAKFGAEKDVAAHFPIPRDIVFSKLNEDEIKRRKLDPENERNPLRLTTLRLLEFGETDDAPKRLRHGAPEPIRESLLFSEKEPEKSPPRRFLTEPGMRRYLRNELADEFAYGKDFILAGDAYREEPRVGIARSPDTHATQEGMYYVTRPYRFAPGYGFAVDVVVDDEATKKLIDALHGQAVPLGGKGHQARVLVSKGDKPLLASDFEVPASGAERVKRVFVTPLPLPLPEKTQVACMVTDRAVQVGGFDLAKRAPKPLKRALPIGTVVWTSGAASLCSNNDVETTMEQRMGYGFALGGACKS